MACPKCGGDNREPIAPGYYRCTSAVRLPATPDPLDGYGPSRIAEYASCGNEYQEDVRAQPTEACACGTFAIGRCAVCGRPVCGIHSRVEDVRLCLDDLAARNQEQRAAEEAEERRRADDVTRTEALIVQLAGQLFRLRPDGGILSDGRRGPVHRLWPIGRFPWSFMIGGGFVNEYSRTQQELETFIDQFGGLHTWQQQGANFEGSREEIAVALAQAVADVQAGRSTYLGSGRAIDATPYEHFHPISSARMAKAKVLDGAANLMMDMFQPSRWRRRQAQKDATRREEEWRHSGY